MAYNLDHIIRAYNYPPDVTTREWLDDDYYYYKLITTERDAERFNYHSDHWGDAETYQNDNVDLMAALEPLIGSRCSAHVDGDYIEGTLEGMLIDKQYNSIGHTCILLSDVTDESGERIGSRGRLRRRSSSRKTARTPGKYDCRQIYRPSDAPDDVIADIMSYWFDCSAAYGDRGSCVIGAGFMFKYRGKWYFMHSQSPWQGSLSWEDSVPSVKSLLYDAGAEDITYDWGMMD